MREPSLRQDCLTRNLFGNAAKRFFTLGFAFEQTHSNFKHLARCVAGQAGTPKERKGGESDKQS